MGALLVPTGDLPFNANWPVVGRFGVVALVENFSSVLLRVRERDEDPDLEKRWTVLGRPRSGSVDPKTWSTDRGFGSDGPPMSQGGGRSGYYSMEGPWQGVGGDGEVFKSAEWLLV